MVAVDVLECHVVYFRKNLTFPRKVSYQPPGLKRKSAKLPVEAD
jgi:hypothetical protein